MARPRREGQERGAGWRLSRRAFLGHAGAAGVAVTASSLVAARLDAAPPCEPAETFPSTVGTVPVTLLVNGTTHALRIEPRVTLLDALRETLQLPGTKKGCDHGQCGACTVHVDGRRVNSCLTLAIMHQGEPITTIEGIAH